MRRHWDGISVSEHGDAGVLTHCLVNGPNKARHAIDLSIAEAAIVWIGTVSPRYVQVELEGGKSPRPHLNCLPTVTFRRGGRSRFRLSEIVSRGVVGITWHPGQLA